MERRDLIAGRLAQGRSVAANALAQEFGVSEDAIRRDLRALADAGICRRVYGGALPMALASLPMADRLQEGRSRKRALARAALRAVEAGELVFLDSSSANVELARILPLEREITVATNSIDVASVMVQRSLRLLMIGGVVDPVIGGCVDASAVAAVTRLNIDRCFMGVCAVSAESGVSAIDHADAIFKRAVMAASRRRWALIMKDKLETRAPHRIGAIDEFDTLIVEHDSADMKLEPLSHAGAKLLRADAPDPD
jgi:DeoR/GlpR family transcriptional regulator of sugar metabolism